MTRNTPSFPQNVIALQGAGLADATTAPEWIHLLPAGDVLATADARGPYTVADAGKLIEASFAEQGKLPIDENHATDLAAPLGLPAPARGWIVEMQSRQDGIWGRVDWTDEGRALVSGHAYRAISPVVRHDGTKRIGAILRASLVNKPNLKGLQALNMENAPVEELLAKLKAMLGLPADAEDEAIWSAMSSVLSAAEAARALSASQVATQAQVDELGAVFGLPAGKPVAEVLAAAKGAKPGDAGAIVALQAELSAVTTQLNGVMEERARERATSYVDGQIAAGRVGVKPLRQHYIDLHMENAGRVETMIAALPILGKSGAAMTAPQPVTADGTIALNAQQDAAAKLLGLDPKKFAETLKAERAARGEEAL